MTTRLLVALAIISAGCTGPGEETAVAGEGTPSSETVRNFEDPEVARIYAAMAQRQGSTDDWNRVRFLAFDWIVRRDEGDVRRSHEWDKHEGRARVQWSNEGSETVVILDAMNPLRGRAWVDGVEMTGADAEAALDRAYRIHINDAYWLVMPFKWADPGVNARYLGTEDGEDGRTFEVVELTFEGVGVTPENKYHAYVNPETGLMERWAHHSTRDAEPSFADWGGYERVGPLLLALDKGRIQFENVRAVEGALPAGAFAAPQ
ncbi:MAG: hypothetical protein OEO23_13275 [Gemmatimonadota bacterium]|nr:hypothetical protein [Gemmatimonadota bacterium]